MKRPKKDPVREDRIHNEAIVDANGPEEQVMGWHCYLDDKIRSLFRPPLVSQSRFASPYPEFPSHVLSYVCLHGTG
jgi:calcium binding protein